MARAAGAGELLFEGVDLGAEDVPPAGEDTIDGRPHDRDFVLVAQIDEADRR